MTRRAVPLVALLLVLGCGAVLLVAIRSGAMSSRPLAEPTKEPELEYPVGAFALTERSGAAVTDKDLRGSVWVGSFIFTRCSGTCPAVTSSMQRLQDDLAPELKGGKLKLVTFTVDPKHDDLQTLNRYADARKADPKHWLFLTGDEQTIHTLMREQFKQAVERRVGPDVPAGEEFDHSPRLVVVDKGGVIRAMYSGLPGDDPESKARFEAGLVRLKDRVRELLR